MLSKLRTNELEFVDETEVPPRPRAKSPWGDIFAKIPRGKALVLRDAAQSTVRTALSRYQKKGRFKNYYVTTRKVGDAYVSYVVNAAKKEE